MHAGGLAAAELVQRSARGLFGMPQLSPSAVGCKPAAAPSTSNHNFGWANLPPKPGIIRLALSPTDLEDHHVCRNRRHILEHAGR